MRTTRHALIPMLLVACVVYAAPKKPNPATLQTNTAPEPDLAQPGFVELFNGRDLEGWSVKGGKMAFAVSEGEIVGTCVPREPNGFLCTDKVYSNFIFTTEFKWDVLGNSGIMFRAGLRKQGERRIRVFGYQSEMDAADRRWTGGIYGEAMGGWKYPLSKPEAHAAARAAITNPADWNRMTVVADGNVIKTWINGIPCAHLVNDERKEGVFGLQVHSGKQGSIRWRNIKLKTLPER